MKKTLLISLALWLGVVAPCLYAQDTIKIHLDNQTNMWVTSPDRASLRKLLYLDINHLVRDAIRKGEESEYDPDDSTKTNRRERKIHYRIDGSKMVAKNNRRAFDFNNVYLDLGLTNYLEDGQFPDNLNKPYGLSSFGSRYFAISTNQEFGARKFPISFRVGLEFGVHNFMFQGNNYISRNALGDSIVFRDYKTDFQRSLRRSKLVVPYLNIPIALRFNIHKRNILLDLGGYVGYRLGSYSSVRLDGDRGKQRTHNNYLLNNWRYGLEAAFTMHDITLFARYDLNPLFAPAHLPKLNTFTLGLRLDFVEMDWWW